jgi:hypothetical protein
MNLEVGKFNLHLIQHIITGHYLSLLQEIKSNSIWVTRKYIRSLEYTKVPQNNGSF